ncbi:sin3 associated polypeptide p18 (SAP18) domain-containing protein [Trichoderma breve]|uniref:Sin3 associated polypeptide p18 (SAP18) domain-containing protein n=1 Tax=Trichoderma breve TaxID=2034170 RepID=A0A9W9B7R6_9HYPO|nr:sin3 associated polypeptide p18 (SAP18) domain-containing protein [Trichoderma breve]KAJ4855345.1 sin3 associated polypeptide p18 (SAP18) domain-containing protein [Trichoderma breve]
MVDARASEDEDTSPFLVRLFHRTGSFYRPEEFASASLPPHVSIYTWSTCTLYELALELAAAKPSALPSPAIGTRLSFQLVCPDLRGTSTINAGQPKFAVKELGSIVIGEGYPGAENLDDADPDVMKDDSEKDKTLADWRFVVVATTVARVGRRAGEITDFRLVIGGEESSYRMGHLGGHEAEDAGIRLQGGLASEA